MKVTVVYDLSDPDDREEFKTFKNSTGMRWTLFEIFYNFRKQMRWWIDGHADKNDLNTDWMEGASEATEKLFDMMLEEAEINELNIDQLP